MSVPLRTHRVPSRALREERRVRVLMPDEPRAVLVLNDGQNADALELAAALREKGLGPRRLRLLIEDGTTHHERHWAARLPAALRFLFS